jgi:hypothetical protein
MPDRRRRRRRMLNANEPYQARRCGGRRKGFHNFKYKV